MPEVILSTGDATVRSYTVSFDNLQIEITLWDETVRSVTATGVTYLEDAGTSECDGIVRLPDLDSEQGKGYAVLSTEAEATLRFRAADLDLGDTS